ncbi:MAG: hypothetical protein NTW26_00290 [bacterium]|nr:hypothetical protein [bacterium]
MLANALPRAAARPFTTSSGPVGFALTYSRLIFNGFSAVQRKGSFSARMDFTGSACAPAARWKFKKPGPATSTRSTKSPRTFPNSPASASPIWRGFFFNGPASCSARLQAKCPNFGSAEGERSKAGGPSGRPKRFPAV